MVSKNEVLYDTLDCIYNQFSFNLQMDLISLNKPWQTKGYFLLSFQCYFIRYPLNHLHISKRGLGVRTLLLFLRARLKIYAERGTVKQFNPQAYLQISNITENIDVKQTL